uniref:Uncharacterized protein n=1 Tax=Bicosoecida sp. CB-2014 TaxID=1486930 RepID=A0A7S1CBT3_9STRA|mmetsp:Transcript_18922/g.66836  ORF Transcript_18922/g.66836 Transcript_18922/m.66836 type:complete len:558 (+) Transcript_18922:226-1899(+)
MARVGDKSTEVRTAWGGHGTDAAGGAKKDDAGAPLSAALGGSSRLETVVNSLGGSAAFGSTGGATLVRHANAGGLDGDMLEEIFEASRARVRPGDVLVTLAMVLLLPLIGAGTPYLPGYKNYLAEEVWDNWLYVFFHVPVGFGVVSCGWLATIAYITRVEVTWRQMAALAVISGAAGMIIEASFVLAGIFPVPIQHFLVGGPGCCVGLAVLLKWRVPRESWSDAEFKKAFKRNLAGALLALGVFFVLVAFRIVFEIASSAVQAFLSLLLPFMLVVSLKGARVVLAAPHANSGAIYLAEASIAFSFTFFAASIFGEIEDVTSFVIIQLGTLGVACANIAKLWWARRKGTKAAAKAQSAVEPAVSADTAAGEGVDGGVQAPDNADGKELPEPANAGGPNLDMVSLGVVGANRLAVAHPPQLVDKAISTALQDFTKVISPLFSLIMNTFMFWGPNKPYYEAIDQWNEDQYWQSVKFTGIDVCVRILVLVVEAAVVVKVFRLNITRIAWAALRRWRALLAWSFAATIMFAYCIKLKHSGLDHTFEFKWMQGDKSGAVNAPH